MNHFTFCIRVFPPIAVLALFLAIVPGGANAEYTQGDIECGTKYCFPGKCVPKKEDPKCVPCPTFTCTDVTNKKTTKGKCISSAPGVCRGTSTEGIDGKNQQLGGQIPKEIMDALKGILDKLLQQKPEDKPQQPQQQQGQQGEQPCPAYYQVNQPTPNDRCAIYTPGSSNLITPALGQQSGQNAVSDLLKSLTGEEGAAVKDEDGTKDEDATGEESDEDSETSDQSGETVGTSKKDLSDTSADSDVGVGDDLFSTASIESGGEKELGGLKAVTDVFGNLVGRFEEGVFGVTAIGGKRDETSRVEVSGFYGQSGAFQGRGGMITRLCLSRPWAGSLISYIVPSSFFDGLCEARGYGVTPSVPVVQSTPVVSSASKKQESQAEVEKPVVPKVMAEAHIWAVPARVSVGSRTSIFWNSKGSGIESCTATSPDGSFSETGFSGGASTVPLSGPTIFTISCIVTDGAPVTDHVTVEMAI